MKEPQAKMTPQPATKPRKQHGSIVTWVVVVLMVVAVFFYLGVAFFFDVENAPVPAAGSSIAESQTPG